MRNYKPPVRPLDMANHFLLYIWQMVFVQQLRFVDRQLDIEIVEVSLRGHDDGSFIEHCLQFCVYRHERFIFPCVTK